MLSLSLSLARALSLSLSLSHTFSPLDFNSGANVITVRSALSAAISKLPNDTTFMTYDYGASPERTAANQSASIAAAVKRVQGSDVAIIVVGDTMKTCGEMIDRSSLDLPGAQLALLQELAAKTTTPLVLLLINGRPTTFGRGNTVLDSLSALFVGWRPGEEGGPAFVNLLLGDANPSARLTQAWPRSVGGIHGPGAPYLYPFQGNHQGEAYSGGDGKSDALFQFGEGLSYTSFVLSDLTIAPTTPVRSNGTFTLKLKCTNTGARDGATPIMVFFRDPVALPVRISSIQLVRFTKVLLKAGEAKEVEIELKARDLGFWDDGLNGGGTAGWKVDPGTFNLVLGTMGFTSWQNPVGLKADVVVLP